MELKGSENLTMLDVGSNNERTLRYSVSSSWQKEKPQTCSSRLKRSISIGRDGEGLEQDPVGSRSREDHYIGIWMPTKVERRLRLSAV